jgi:hypothetical protein
MFGDPLRIPLLGRELNVAPEHAVELLAHVIQNLAGCDFQ